MTFQDVKKTAGISLWFMFLTFPILVIRVNAVNQTVIWRWNNLILIGLGTFFGGLVWRYALSRRKSPAKATTPVVVTSSPEEIKDTIPPEQFTGIKGKLLEFKLRFQIQLQKKPVKITLWSLLALIVIIFPQLSSLYQTSVMITALIYVMLALGLNIVIGLGGMLHLGYIAFFAVGAYTYGILFRFFGIGFWVALPIAALLSTLFGVLLALPVLRLRGDYLAIVTLGFAEIVRIVLNNTADFSGGPAGIRGIPRPTFFGTTFNLAGSTTYIYYLIALAVFLTIFIVWRFENSRIGRALVAMGEDDIAAEAMGIDIAKVKLIAFGLGSFLAGVAGVIFASRTTFINPTSFTVWQSIIVLSCVVLGGMGSIPGVTFGAMALILIPEYLRAFSDYRMIIFGAVLVIMMVFRPGGLIQKKRKAYTFDVSILEEQS